MTWKKIDEIAHQIQKIQRSITEGATGKDLDELGAMLNVKRYGGEDDTTYRSRITLLSPTPGSPASLQAIIDRYPGAALMIEMFDGTVLFVMTEENAGWGVVPTAWKSYGHLEDLLNAERPAGVHFDYLTRQEISGRIDKAIQDAKKAAAHAAAGNARYEAEKERTLPRLWRRLRKRLSDRWWRL